MKYPVDFFSTAAAGIFHEMAVATGHGCTAVPQQLGQRKLSLASSGQPGCVCVAQRMKDDTLPCVRFPLRNGSTVSQNNASSGIIQAAGIHGSGKSVGRRLLALPGAGREEQIRRWTRRKTMQGRTHLLGHDGMAGAPVLAFANVKRAVGKADVGICQRGDFTETESAMQGNQRHQPRLLATASHLLQEHARLIRLKIAHTPVIRLRQPDALKRIRPVIQAPGPHSPHDSTDESYRQKTALGGKSLCLHISQEAIQPVRRDFRKPKGDEWPQMPTHERGVTACILPLRQQPVPSISLPGISKREIFLGRLLRDRCLAADELAADPICPGGRHACAGPANGMTLPFSVLVPIIYDIGDIRSSIMAPDTGFVDVNTGEFRALSFCHLVTIWCPCGVLGDHLVALTRNPLRHTATSIPLIYIHINPRLYQATVINNGVFRLITGRSQVRSLVGPPALTAGILYGMPAVFLSGGHGLPAASARILSALLEHFPFETLCVSNHTAWRFAEKTRFFRALLAGLRCAAASRFTLCKGKTHGPCLACIQQASLRA